MVERRVIRQKFQNAVKNKRHICIVKHLNILCLVCVNILLPLKLSICLHSRVPEIVELKNSLLKSPNLNSVNYSVWGHCHR